MADLSPAIGWIRFQCEIPETGAREARGRQEVDPGVASPSMASSEESPIMTTQSYMAKSGKRTSLALAALAVGSLFIASIAPAVAAQYSAPNRTTSHTTPGGPDGGRGNRMPTAACNDFGYANMPSGCLTRAVACICPDVIGVGYQAPSSCEGIGRVLRQAAERNCTQHSATMREAY
jgi:hypothetical protein